MYAFWGLAPASVDWVRQTYRTRFGIETSYRQKNQARGWTTSRDVGYRLLLEGVAHLVRQIWVLLNEERAHAGRQRPTAWVGLRMADLLESLADDLKAQHPRRCDDQTT